MYLLHACDSARFMVVYPHNQKAEIAFVRLELKVRSAVSIGFMEGD